MKRLYKLACLQLVLLLSSNLFAQQIVVLPGNDNYSPQTGPQGALRTQRQFYLIRPAEMKTSGLPGGSVINKIGFTIGIPQNAITKGAFKVWLQNTADKISRVDSSWKEVTITTNTHSARFFPGEYEVQVIPVASCPIVADTARFTFSNKDLDPCQPPTGLKTNAITATSATLNWVAPANAPTQYKVSYRASDAAVWTTANTATTSLNIAGLTQNKLYLWRVVSDCSGDSSDVTGINFTTGFTSVCNPPTGLTVIRYETSAADTLAVLKWTAAAGATFYSVNYRRVGTVDWANIPAFADSLVVRHLLAGTSYEWQVKTNCPSGSGSYQTAPGPFTTLGTTRCYAPSNISVNTLTDSTAVITWDAYIGVTSHKIRYRLKGTIPWTNAINGMTLVHNDSLTIPNQTGLDSVTFNLGSPFTYTADSGLYVAFEYSRLTGPLSSQNISVSTTVDSVRRNINGGDSIRYALSFSSRSDSGRVIQDSVLTNSAYRPETYLGSASLVDSVAVLAVWTLGKTAPRFQDSTFVSAQLSNRSLTTDRRFGVRLTIKQKQSGLLRYTIVDSITIRAAVDTIITFKGWLPTTLEDDSIIVSIDPRPTENILNNNSKGFIQSVNPNIIAYADGTTPIAGVGFDTGAGLMLTKYTLKGCGQVMSAQVFLTKAALGHSVYAVIRDTAGVITKSNSFTMTDSTQANSYHSFYFHNPVPFSNVDFYIGLAQPASATTYRPVGAQYENAVNRSGSFFKANLDGTGLVDSSGFGRLMIRAEVVTSVPQPFIDSTIAGQIYICPSSTKVLRTVAITERFADSLMSYSSQQAISGLGAQEVLGTPNVYPSYGVTSGAWLPAQPDSTRPNKHEYLELRFANSDTINYIDIYETLNPGSVDSAWVRNVVTNAWDLVYSGQPDTTLPATARKQRLRFASTPNWVTMVKLAFNSGKIPGYSAIDAVAIGRTTAPAFATYAWTGPGIVGPTNTPTITVNAPGKYKVNVSTGVGCSGASDSVTVVTSPASVSVSPVGPFTLCQGDSIWLKSSMVGGNLWSNGSTADSIKVKTTGNYSLTNNVGCGTLTSNTVAVTVNRKPKATITGNLNICPSLTTTLDGGPTYNSYQWKNAAGTVLGTARTQVISVSGLVKLVVDSLGCKDSITAFVADAPGASPVITGTLQFCTGQSTTLSTGSFSTYEWRNGANVIVGTNPTLVVTTADNFTVRVSNGFGCFGTSPSVTTSFFAFTAPTISGNSSFCPGNTVTITASAGYSSYVWRNSGGSIVGTNQNLVVSSASTYTVTATAANGCSGTASRTITVSPVPTPVITGSLVFCPGGNPTVLDAGAGFVTYEWRNGAGTIIGTNQTVSVFSADNFIVTVTNAAGCSGTSAPATTVFLPFTPPTISGNSAFCPGTSVTLTASTGYTLYEWRNSLGSIVGTNAVLAVTVADTYTVTVTAANGCKGSLSKIITQTVPPHPVISGSLQFCAGGSTVLSGGPGYTSYIWKNAAGTVLGTNQTFTVTVPGFIRLVVDSTGGCSDSISAVTTTITGPSPVISGSVQFCSGTSTTLNAGAGFSSYTWLLNGTGIVGTNQTLTVLAAGNYSVIVTNASGCSGTSPSVTVSVLPLPTPTISGNSTYCPAGSVTLTANAGYTAYLWTGGFTTPAITVNIAGTYTVTVTGTNGCIGSTSKVISQAAAPTPTISGLLNICNGSTTTLDAGVGYTNYSWFPGGATTQTITVGTAATYIVTVTNASGCSASATAVVTVANGVPAMPGPIAGPTTGLCNTTGNVYSITPVPNTDYYVWTVPSGATIVGPANGPSITVSYNNLFTTGLITVTALNVCGQNPTSNPRQLAVTSIPSAPGPITGQVNGVCQRNAVTYSIATVTNATSYTWTVPAGATIASGQGTNTITVNFSGTYIDGNITVLASSNCGSSIVSSLLVTGATVTPGPISGATIGDCRLESQTYTIAAVPNATSYTWVVPPRVTILEGQGTTSVKVKFDDDFVTGDLCVYTNTSCGRSAYRCLTVFESPCPNFIVYPNPTTGSVKALVKFGPYGKYTLTISNFLTQIVYQKEITWNGTDITLDLNHLPAGVYDVTIFNETYKRTTKLMKAK